MERPFLELKPNKWKSQVNLTALLLNQCLTKITPPIGRSSSLNKYPWPKPFDDVYVNDGSSWNWLPYPWDKQIQTESLKFCISKTHSLTHCATSENYDMSKRHTEMLFTQHHPSTPGETPEETHCFKSSRNTPCKMPRAAVSGACQKGFVKASVATWMR